MDTSVIIVNYKTADLVVECIKSIIKFTTGLSYEVIVVDNNSSDGCGETLKSEFPEARNIKFVQLEVNKGFGLANNAGFSVASGRNLLCLNPDTLLLNNAVKTLSDFIDSHSDVGACGGNLFDADMKPTQSFFRNLPSLVWNLSLLTFRKVEKLVYRGNVTFNHTARPIEVGYVTAQRARQGGRLLARLLHVLRGDRPLLPHKAGRLQNSKRAASQDTAP